MSAEILRKAAALMRERAQWCYADGDLPEWYDTVEMGAILRQSEPEHSRIDRDAEHIASWHPAVALLAADLLDRLADDRELDPYLPKHFDEAAVEFARAYLGGAA